MRYLEADPLADGWNWRTALVGDNRLAVPVRVYVATVKDGGREATGLAYMLDRMGEWMEPAAFVDHLLFVRQDAELQAVQMVRQHGKVTA